MLGGTGLTPEFRFWVLFASLLCLVEFEIEMVMIWFGSLGRVEFKCGVKL